MNRKTILFTLFALFMLALSVVAARAYSIDLSTYPLMIKDLKITGENQIRFSLYNPAGTSNFDTKNLKSLEISFNKAKTIQQFVHYVGDPLTVIGDMKDGESRNFIVKFDRYDQTNTDLRCRQPIDINIFMKNGQSIAHWSGVPDCEIIGKRPCGLLKIDDTVAEFEDEVAGLKIMWEFLDYNKESNKVLLMKSVGRNDPVMQWVRVGECMDIESGKCMTDILDITFGDDLVSVTLQDNRKKLLATLTKTYAPQATVTYTMPVQQAAPSQPVQPQATNSVAYQAAQQIGLLDANAPATSGVICASNCALYDRCYDEGSRNIRLINYVYCKDGWQVQKSNGFFCSADFECQSSKCHNSKCTNNTEDLTLDAPKESFITRMLFWIDNLF